MRLPKSLLENYETAQKLAMIVIRDSKTLFDGEYPTKSVIGATLDGEGHTNLTDPIILWFRRETGTLESK